MARFDILGIGNAIVDVVARADDAFLSKHDMRKGGMTLIDADTAASVVRGDAAGAGEQRRIGCEYLRGGGGAGEPGGVSGQSGGRPAGRGVPPRYRRGRSAFSIGAAGVRARRPRAA